MPSYLCTLQAGAHLLVVAEDKSHLFKALSKFDDPTQCSVRELPGPLAIEVEPTLKGHLRHSSKRFKGYNAALQPSALPVSLWRDRQFTDCVLTAKDGATEAVHRCVVAAACPHLAEQLQKLQRGSHCKIATIAQSREVLSAFVRFLYTNDVGELEAEESWQLLELAFKYHLPKLAQMCDAVVAEFYEAFCLDKSHAHWAVPLPLELQSALETADCTLAQAAKARVLGRYYLEDFFLWNAARYGWKVLITCPSLKGISPQQVDYLRCVVATAFPPVIRRWTLGVAQTVCSNDYDKAGGELTIEEATALNEWRQLSASSSACQPSTPPEPFCLDEESLEAQLLSSNAPAPLQLGRVRLCGEGGEEVLAAAVFPTLAQSLPRTQLGHLPGAELQACKTCLSRTNHGRLAKDHVPPPTKPDFACSLCRLVNDVRAALVSDLTLLHQASLNTKATEAEAMARAERGDLRAEVMLRASIMAPMYSLAQHRTTPDKDSNESEDSGFSDDSDDEDEEDMVVDMDSNEWLQGFVIAGPRDGKEEAGAGGVKKGPKQKSLPVERTLLW